MRTQQCFRGAFAVLAASALCCSCREQTSPAPSAGKPSQPSNAPPSSAVAVAPAEAPALQVSIATREGPWRERQTQQIEASRAWKTFHRFRFQDRREESGITFRHKMVDDAGKYYKPVHYDHGNGLAAADVDLDGLPDLYFVTQLGSNELWRNRGDGTFENLTERAGVGLAEVVSVAASFADIDNDGDPDLFVTTVKTGNALFLNMGEGRFKDVTAEAGLHHVGHSSGAVFFDFNRDGLLDLFLTNVGVYTRNERGAGGYFVGYADAFSGHLMPERTEQSILYQNLGDGRFKDVSSQAGVVDTGWSGDASPCDVNEDGFLDLYVLNMQGNDHLYLNQDGTQFVEKIQAYFPKTAWGAMGIKFLDYNGDGLMDLYITDMHSDMSDSQTEAGKDDISSTFDKQKSQSWCTMFWSESYLQGSSNNVFGNVLYRNEGKGRFREVSDEANAETYWPWGVSVGDLNADGYDDLVVTAGMGYPYRYSLNSLLLNEQGKRFVDSEYVLGVEPRVGDRQYNTAFVLYCSGQDADHPLCAGRSGRMGVRGALSSRSAVILDLENDGDQDIVINDFNDRPQILVSDLAERRQIRFVKIQLRGRDSNHDGFGATVTVHAGGRSVTQAQDGKSGYLSQSVLPLYFGLEDAETIDSIEVRWPSGRRQTVSDGIQLNALNVIEEP